MSNTTFEVTINHTEHGTRSIELYQNKAITSQKDAENHVASQYEGAKWQVAFSGKATAPGFSKILASR